MIILTRQNNALPERLCHRPIVAGLRAVFCLLFFLSATSLFAQEVDQLEQTDQKVLESEEVSTEEIELVSVSLPASRQMALALVTPQLREQALLDLAVAAHIVNRAEDELSAGNEVDHTVLAQTFLDDRAWLQSLIDLYGWDQPHSSVLDPAAWLLFNETQKQGLQSLPLLIPGHTPKAVLVYQVFQRSGPLLAVSNLPILLLEIEADVISLWDAFLQLTEVGGSPDAAWKSVEIAWFTDRVLPVPPQADTSSPPREPLLDHLSDAMSGIVLSAVDTRPPDHKGLMQLKYSILAELPELAAEEGAGDLSRLRESLHLVNLIDGLHEGRYFDFVQGLLSVTFRLLENPGSGLESLSLVDWLVTELPAISAHYAGSFALVEPHLNTVLAATYDVLVAISSARVTEAASQESGEDGSEEISIVEEPAVGSETPGVDFAAATAALADAVAQMALLIPDMAYYFDTPVRARIAREINLCISLAAERGENGDSTMMRLQFDSCMQTLLQLANRETRLAELSGDMNGPYTNATLRRELSVAPWQRINYAIGYLDERFITQCLPPANVLPNPLEWSVLANVMSWFAEQFPDFFNTTENENRISRMRNIGEEIVLAMVEQAECLAASGTGVNDLVSRIMIDYEIALRELDSGIEGAEDDFRSQRLKPGADVEFDKGANQKTAYRPDDLVIAPCNTQAVCEMSGNLSATRALIGLFPDEYLIADQTGMGRIEICYRNMEWVQRRSELVRADDENVSNYFGHLGFDLVGRYLEDDEESDIFGFRFTAPEEHHYLFAQASEEVLSDSCPVKWVGSRTITPLRVDRGGIVPNRLTYLAAARMLPSRLLQNNWDRGAEWRDWFVTGIGVSPLELRPAPEITTSLDQHLQALYQAGQLDIYQRILLPTARNSQGEVVSLYNEMSEVSIAKAMLHTQMMLFYPQSLIKNDSVREAIVGDAGLLEQRTLRRFKGDNVPLTSVSRIAGERLFKFREEWSKLPENVRRKGSIPASMVHALTRINMLYQQFFISRPEVLQEVEVPAVGVPEE